MNMNMKRLEELAVLTTTLREMGFNAHEEQYELFCEDGTDVFVFFDDGESLRWTVRVERDAAEHREEFYGLRTRDVEDVLNKIGLYCSVEMQGLKVAYEQILPYTSEHKNPREEAEKLYQTNIMDDFWHEVEILAKQYSFPNWTCKRDIQFDRVVKNLLAIQEEADWLMERMDI